MKPIVLLPPPGPLALDGHVQLVPADDAADVQTTAKRTNASTRGLTTVNVLLRRFMRNLLLECWVGVSDALAECLGRELTLPAQQEDEDGKGEDVREGVQHELVDVVA